MKQNLCDIQGFCPQNKGLQRKQMPQLKDGIKSRLLNYIQCFGLQVTTDQCDPKALKPIQAEVHMVKVREMIKNYQAGKFPTLATEPIIISEDNYIIDGHHRWAACKLLKLAITVNQVQLDADTLLDWCLTFPGVQFEA
jgi:hypothetical protein